MRIKRDPQEPTVFEIVPHITAEVFHDGQKAGKNMRQIHWQEIGNSPVWAGLEGRDFSDVSETHTNGEPHEHHRLKFAKDADADAFANQFADLIR